MKDRKRGRGLFRRALRDRPDGLMESLFLVKVKRDQQIQGRGIACAVEKEVRGERKFFLLTNTDVKKVEGRVYAHRCYNRSVLKPKRNSVEVDTCFENSDFSFIPLDCVPEKSLKLVPEEKIGQQFKCRSFVVTQSSLKTFDCEYNEQTKRHQLMPENIELEEPNVLGSPILWKDNNSNRSYVVGLVSRSSDGIFFPKMLIKSSLHLTGKNISLVMFFKRDIYLKFSKSSTEKLKIMLSRLGDIEFLFHNSRRIVSR